MNVLLYAFAVIFSLDTAAQNIFSGEPVQWVGRPNGYSTEPYNSDYRTLGYRKISTTAANPADGRGQWATTINVQIAGGDITPDNMPGGGGAGWLLISGPEANRFQNKWNFNGIGQAAINSTNDITFQSGGEDMGLDMSAPGYYTFVMSDTGYANSDAFVAYTAAEPVTVTRAADGFVSGVPGIGISTSATPSAGENVFVRYSTTANDFTTATSIVQASGSGTTWIAALPTQPCGTTIYYYVFTSTRTLAQLTADSEADRSLAAISYDDNAGSNYSLEVGPASTAAVLTGGAGICAGSSSTLQVAITGGTSPYTVVLTDGTNEFTFTNYTSGNAIIVTPASTSTYTIANVFSANGCAGTGNSGSAVITVNPLVTYYADADGDGFGDLETTQTSCTGAPVGFVANSLDCDDNLLTWEDLDTDGFGSDVAAPCGVENSDDCDDSNITYSDEDFDGFGSDTIVACDGVANSDDCDDNLVTWADNDGDGFGSEIAAPCGVLNTDDCDDNQLVYTDNDFDGFGVLPYLSCFGGSLNNLDCDDAAIYFVDADGDGFGSEVLSACPGVTNSDDCDDSDPGLNSQGGHFYQDLDEDGFGNPDVRVFVCFQPEGYVTDSSDCDDTNPEVNVGSGATTFYQDLEGDGFGNPNQPLVSCSQPEGYVLDNTDCDDFNELYVDLDGDGFGSDTLAACGVLNSEDCDDAVVLYADVDGDGFGSDTMVACDGVTNSDDCDDTNPEITTGGGTFYADTDGDGFGDAANSVSACVQPDGYVANSTDCNDTLAFVYPNAPELFNGIDDDCDGSTDEGFPVVTTTIGTNYCGITLSAINSYIYANLVAGAQGYRWRVTTITGPDAGEVQVHDTNLRAFRLTSLPNFAFATTYQVEIAVRIGGFYQAYSPSVCTITSPSPTTQLGNCGATLTTFDQNIFANLVNYAAGYRFRITDSTNPAMTQEIDRPIRDFKMSMVTAFTVLPSTVYNVEVAVLNTDGTYLPYGATCTVTTPTGIVSGRAPEVDFTAVAYPNPFADSFSIDITSAHFDKVNVKVYDMAGRILDDRNTTISEAENFKIGERYPAGVYNVIVSQGSESKAIRMIKR